MRDMFGDAKGNAGGHQALVAVAIDKDKSSQAALKWAVDNTVTRGQTIVLVHVKTKPVTNEEAFAREMFLPFRCFCTRKDINCIDVSLDGSDIAKAVIEFVSQNAIEKLVVGTPAKSAFMRFKMADVPTSISKGAPDFCTVSVISKGKVSSVRKAVRQAPTVSPLRSQIENAGAVAAAKAAADPANVQSVPPLPSINGGAQYGRSVLEEESVKSPYGRHGVRSSMSHLFGELAPDTDISFVSSGRPSTDRMFPAMYEDMDVGYRPQRLSNASDRSYDMLRTPRRSVDTQHMGSEYSGFSQDSGSSWSASQTDDVEAEMRRLRLELKQTMDMYNAACREALSAKQKAGELHRWKVEEEQKMLEVKLNEESALAMIEREKAKAQAAVEAALAAQRIAEMESQKRLNAEKKALVEAEERKKAMQNLARNDIRYRKYSIEEIELATEYFSPSRKVGEGGYGPVFKCYLDHTPVAVKVLRPDAAQGRSQFQQEVEVLSCIRHPNMVLLLGACPEYGCLVYEYLSNGSLEDRLFRRGNTPVLPWQLRFRIACEIATGLLFLHQTKPEPLVHRDLKPANILLDRNFVSKISDVGLARLVPPTVANNVTQYRMTSTAGTFCYIDPEYQQTGMLGIKSDIYSLGIMLLQIITAKPPMGLTFHVADAIENGTFEKMLDPAVPDWPIEETLVFAKLALKCGELRRRDRPDLGTVVLPELQRLSDMADSQMFGYFGCSSSNPSPVHSAISMSRPEMSEPHMMHSESESSVGIPQTSASIS